MSRSVNKITLIGTCGADPEIRYTPAGMAIVTVSLATNESWTDKATGELRERTEWHRVKVFGGTAEVAAKFLKKGKQVYFEGKNRTDKYTDKNGIERYTTSVMADEMVLLGVPSNAEKPEAPPQAPPQARPAHATPPADFDDELSF